MFAILHSLGMFVADLFKSRCRLEAENLFLRHQLNIALRQAPPRLRLRGSDRALLVWMTQLWPSLLGAAQVVEPETILRWRRAGWKAFWRWKSRKRAGCPKIERGCDRSYSPLPKARASNDKTDHIGARAAPSAGARQAPADYRRAVQALSARWRRARSGGSAWKKAFGTVSSDFVNASLFQL